MGCVSLTVGEESTSLREWLPYNITSGYKALPRVPTYQGTVLSVYPVVCARVGVADAILDRLAKGFRILLMPAF